MQSVSEILVHPALLKLLSQEVSTPQDQKFDEAKLFSAKLASLKPVEAKNQVDSAIIFLKLHLTLAPLQTEIFQDQKSLLAALGSQNLCSYIVKISSSAFLYKYTAEEEKKAQGYTLPEEENIALKVGGEHGFDPDLALLAIHSKGKSDLQFAAHVLTALISAKVEDAGSQFFQKNEKLKQIYKLSQQLTKLKENLKSQEVTKEDYERWVRELAQDEGNYYEQIRDINKRLFFVHLSRHKPSLDYLDDILIKCLGHSDDQVRDNAIVMLNNLYDGVDWQASRAFVPVVRTVGDQFEVALEVELQEKPENYIFLINSPSTTPSDIEYMVTWQSGQFVKLAGNVFKVTLSCGKFHRCGFYDWRLVLLKSDGTLDLVTPHGESEPINPNDSLNDLFACPDYAQGRFIVHPQVARDIQAHEVFVDAELSLVDGTDRTKISSFEDIRRALPKYQSEGITCLYLLGALERDNGYEEPPHGAEPYYSRPQSSPLAITCRRTACRMLGGEQQLLKVIKEAEQLGIKIIVDCVARISSSRAHRRYKHLLLKCLDDKGAEQYCYGTDGRNINYEDSVLLNYRKKEAWDLLLEDIVSFVKNNKVHGIHLDNGQGWPHIFRLNLSELLRRDPDGERAYSAVDLLNGEVIDRSEEGFGYWSSDRIESYANPFFIKMCKELWRRFPQFLIFAECQGGVGLNYRQSVVAQSGPIPRLFDLPRNLCKIWGKKIRVDGKVEEHGERSTVKELHKWWRNTHRFLPEDAIVAQSSTSHYWPLPALLYKRGAWPAVDVLLFMPDIPFTFMGEELGKAFRVATTNLFQSFESERKSSIVKSSSHLLMAMNEEDEEMKTDAPQSMDFINEAREWGGPSITASKGKLLRVGSASALEVDTPDGARTERELQNKINKFVGPQYGFDLNQIVHHYNHRRSLRKKHSVLRYGKVIPLVAKQRFPPHADHEYVLAFARFSYEETAIITINFNESDVDFFLNMKDLYFQFQKHYKNDTILAVSDLLEPQDKKKTDYYFLDEFINENQQLTIGPFKTIGQSIVVCDPRQPDHAVVRDYALAQSFRRLQLAMSKGQPIDHISTCQQLLNSLEKSNLQRFGDALASLYGGYVIKAKIPVLDLLNRLDSLKDYKTASKFFGFCDVLSQTTSSYTDIHRASIDVMDSNRLGKIVFVAPEFGKFSKIGGLAVMVDELARTMAAQQGQEIVVISPYYEYNKAGQTDYLKEDGIFYSGNIKITSDGKDYTLGVHSGCWEGLELYFLHNVTLFPRPYNEGDSYYMISQQSVFAKGALELCCQYKILPSLICSNDWFTGLVAAYGKNPYFFGDTFKGTTFFHIVHNLERGYEGDVYVAQHLRNKIQGVHGLNPDLVYDFHRRRNSFNPSRCALLTCDQWGTVSKTYRLDLMKGSPLRDLLARFSNPFGYPNGVNVADRTRILHEKVGSNHLVAKEKLQRKYFGFENLDDSVPVFGFIGRITRQKGVHLIGDVAEELIHKYNFKINILVGGMKFKNDKYGEDCAKQMNYLRYKYPACFWASPDQFFTDGPLVNLGCDFGLMPSCFEPGGIVQHEFFVAGTPVIAFETGGLKDSVFEFNWDSETGNGVTFMSHNPLDFKEALSRAIGSFKNKTKYNVMRRNALNSVTDLREVSRAWLGQFCRLRGKVREFLAQIFFDLETKTATQVQLKEQKWQENMYNVAQNLPTGAQGEKPLIPTMFRISNRGQPRFSSVSVQGSFSKWQVTHPLSYDHYTQHWYTSIHLTPGAYTYKYKVNGQWRLSDLEPQKMDQGGIWNNQVIV